MPPVSSSCPRCRRSTASPFAVAGVCLRCAGERVLAEASDDDAEIAGITVDPSPGRRGNAGLPDRIGPYEIIEELGRGGMGYIYAARQIGLGRIVALKVLPTQGNLAGLDLRFLREAQTVARLHHPHIVAVFDSGRTDAYVYFSMEYLSDGDLGRRLRERPFLPREAAELLEKIAAAVAVAHAEGVLHRDIKPSNILLDGEQPKLADFGLAAELEPGGDLTAVSGVLGTPHYLAPEALRGGSGALTVASDIYALGAVLFECLTGRTPFAGVSPVELAALIETHEPPAPRLLAPAIPRDLETICLTCLDRDPVRRYPTAGALAADLHRFLNHQPIHARPPGRLDRWRKFAARHRAGVVAATVATLVLIAATAVSTVMAVRARRAERAAATEAATARALADFLERDLLAQADPAVQPDRNVTLHTVLDRAAGKIDARFASQPLIEADLHAVVGEVYDTLGDYEAACRHLEQTVDFRREHLGERHPDTLAAMHELAGLRFDAGQLAPAEALAMRTYALRRDALGPAHRNTIESANLVAFLLRDRGRLAEADRLATSTVALARQSLDRTDEFAIAALSALGSIRLAEYNYASAEELLKEAADRRVAVSGPDDLRSLTALNDVATVYRVEGKTDAAAEMFATVLAKRRARLGPDHPLTLLSMNNLAAVYRSQKRYAESETLQRATLEAGRKTLGPEHPKVLIWLNNLAETYRLENKIESAIATAQEALALERKVYGETHPNTINSLGRLASLHAAHGEPDLAEAQYREAIAASAKADVPRWRTAVLQSELGALLLQQNRLTEAEPLLVQAYTELRTAGPSLSALARPNVSRAKDRLVELYTRTDRPSAAAALKAP